MIDSVAPTGSVSPVVAFSVLGLIQGLTEFLPVSSSAHLALADRVLRVGSSPLTIQVWVHLATLVAVLVALRGTVWSIARSLVPGDREERRQGRSLALLVVVGTLPAVVFGLLFRSHMDAALEDIRLVGFELLATALILYLSKYFPGGNRPLTLWRAALIGVAQAVAILPGVSRSGATLTAGLALGLPSAEAARFSFLLSIPAILGAAVLDFPALRELVRTDALPLVLSFLIAAVSGYLAIRLVWRVMQRGHLAAFAPYCALVGIAAILFGERLPG